MIEAPNAPWCRVTGRVIGPDAAPHGVGGQVIFDPDPERVTAQVVDGEAPAIVATRVVCVLDSEGYLTSSAGRFVDLVAPGPGVMPGGGWTYRMTVSSGSGQWATRLDEHVTLTQGAVMDISGLVGAERSDGGLVTDWDPSLGWAGIKAVDLTGVTDVSGFFNNATGLSEVKWDPGTTRISSSFGATSITELPVLENLSYISSSFYNTSLKNLDFLSNVTTVNGSFSNCKLVDTPVLPTGCKISYSFEGCTFSGNRDVFVPDSSTIEGSFSSSNIRSISIQNVNSISSSLAATDLEELVVREASSSTSFNFYVYGAKNLRSLQIPSNITKVLNFKDLSISDFSTFLPETVTNIQGFVLNSDFSNELIFPNSLTGILSCFSWGAEVVTSVKFLPGGNSTLNLAASFANTKALVFDFPDTLRTLNNFSPSLPETTEMYFRSPVKVVVNALPAVTVVPKLASIYVPEALIPEYEADTLWSRFKGKFKPLV